MTVTVIDHDTDAGPAIHAAWFEGARHVTLAPHTRWRTLLTVPANTHIIGDSSVVIGDGTTFLNADPGGIIEGCTINDPATTPGKRVGFTANFTIRQHTLSAPNHDPFSIALGGPSGTTDHNGYSATYEGLSTGDLFYGQVCQAATEWRDAIYRGDMHGGGPPGNGVGPGMVFMANLWATAHPDTRGFEIRDERPRTDARQFKISSLHAEAGLQIEQRSSGVGYVLVADARGDLTLKNDTRGAPAIVLLKDGSIQLRRHDVWWAFDFAAGTWTRAR